MSALEGLIEAAGSWAGTNRLQDPELGIAAESEARVAVQPLLGGKFVRLDYGWTYRGQGQEGSLLVGWDAAPGQVTTHWIDSWHMGDKVMACRGEVGPEGDISVLGAYSAPPGPDWGWRIAIRAGANELGIVMHNVDPDGKEELAVEMELSRASGAT